MKYWFLILIFYYSELSRIKWYNNFFCYFRMFQVSETVINQTISHENLVSKSQSIEHSLKCQSSECKQNSLIARTLKYHINNSPFFFFFLHCSVDNRFHSRFPCRLFEQNDRTRNKVNKRFGYTQFERFAKCARNVTFIPPLLYSSKTIFRCARQFPVVYVAICRVW